MFEACELNPVLRALINEWMRVTMTPSIVDDDPAVLAYLVRKTHEAILAAEADQVNLDDARACYDFFCEVESGQEKPAFLQ